jgi:hypothetical protein
MFAQFVFYFVPTKIFYFFANWSVTDPDELRRRRDRIWVQVRSRSCGVHQ